MLDKTVFINEIDLLGSLSDEDKKTFLNDCFAIFNKPVFLKVYNDLISKQMINIGRTVQNMDQLSFMRGSINGIDLFFEEIEKYAQLCEEQARNDEEFDKFKVIEE